MSTVAENIVKALHANGIDRVYGLPGDSLNGFTDALRKNGAIRWVLVRHEESAAFAAAADAATTGQLAVVAGSCGPGNLHLINGLYDANRSRVPVLAIAAHIPTNEIGTGYFQETHPQELFRECSVYVEYVADPRQMPRLLEIAMRAAIEKRGVAVLVIPGDVALADIADDRTVVIERTKPVVVPSGAELERAATLLNEAKSVTILAGAGVEGAHDEVIALADRLGAPIVHALRGKEFIEYDNPFDVGMTGLLGFASGYRAMETADAVLVLGSDFPYEQFYPERATTIQVDIRGAQLGKRHPLDLGLVGDVGATSAALLPWLAEKDRGHLADATAHYRKTRAKLDDLAVPTKAGRAIHPQYLARLLDEHGAGDAIFTADVGSPTVWAARYLSMTEERRLIGSFTHGSMANALMHGIGAQVAHPDRQVVALAGDGGLAMMLGELLTLTQNRLPVKTIVMNNSSLNFIELEMKAAGLVPYGTGLANPSFAAIAEAMGIYARRVENSEDLPEAVREVLAHDGPALLDVVTERQELSMPPAIEAAHVKGLALYAIRTVMSGRGDELLDLARANWRLLL
ncbi:pyruvate dehydrogenase [Microbacterium faecale]|uniref:Pyruvate dehydrogenase [ubiquinone] n=1 Tax=Microbacterium faecale TaxID=1804630 RepID=A0A916YJ86_9MICO|nr:ubiquinone-dependent pyruvate dehydrogenase [Microbacterium faecale]GGD46361.1 pyruvate dehydrogenase [Microbacterium faecale]